MEMLAVENLEKNEFMNIYTCKICSGQFKRKYTAKLHVESKHFPSINGYYCQLCDKYFNTFSAIKSHNYLYHNK